MSRSPYDGRHALQPYQGKHAAATEPVSIAPRVIPIAFVCTVVLVAAFLVFMAISPAYVSHVLGGRSLFANAVDLDVQEDVTPHAQLAYSAAAIEEVGKQDRGRSQACYGYAFAYADTITSGVVHTWKEYDLVGETEAEFSGKGMFSTYSQFESDDEQAILRVVYAAICEGRPAVLHVNAASGIEHWVTIVGFKEVRDLGALTLGNFLMLDPSGADSAEPESLDCRGYALFLGDDVNVHVSKATGTVVSAEQIVLLKHGEKTIQSSGMTQWVRLFGSNALSTMSAIAEEGFQSCNTVVLAARDGYWDALSASGLAGIYDCPVLLTATEGLSEQARYHIEHLGATQVVIVGGEALVGPEVEQQLADLGVSVTRLSGDNAIETAIEVYRAGGDNWGDTAIVATANSFHDALAIAPFAYAKRAPIVLAVGVRGQLDGASYEVLDAFDHVAIAGGVESVAESVEVQLRQNGTDVVRLSGDNAYETSLAVANWCVERGMTADNLGIATGTGHWDALAAGAFCGKLGSVLVLASDENTVAIEGFVQPRASHMARAWVFGGTAAVSNAVFGQLLAATA